MSTFNINKANDLIQFFGKKFDELEEETRSSIRHGIAEAINSIRDRVQSNIATSWFDSVSPIRQQYNTSGGASLSEGLQTFMYKDSPTAVTHILGNPTANDGTWMLRFYEGGTVQRTTRKGANRGSIQPAYFFKNATANIESEVNSRLEQVIEEAAKNMQQ